MFCILGALLCHAASFAIDGSLATSPPHVAGNWGYLVYAGPILAPRPIDPQRRLERAVLELPPGRG